MAKMRVFELARELNIPGKDLIERVKGLGFKIESNFNVLDDEQIAAIRAKMAEPQPEQAKPAAKAPAAAASEEPEAEPEEESATPQRRRRVISARQSKAAADEAAESGEKAKPVLRKRRGEPEPAAAEEAPAAAEGAPAQEDEAVAAEAPAQTEVEETPAEAPAAQPEESEVAQPAAQAPAATPAEPEATEPPSPEVIASRARAKREAEEEAGFRHERKARGTEEQDRGRMRDVRRVERKSQLVQQTDEWVRPPRRKGDRRRGKAPKTDRGGEKHVFEPRKKAIRLGQVITVSELASAIGVKAGDIIKKLFELGVVATINQPIEGSTAELVAAEYSVEVEIDTKDLEDLVKEEAIDPDKAEPRPPIVTIMGHVDHGKTSLLDYIRSSHITKGEAGGITQHIGAYFVRSDSGDIVFLDTPGHEAFTAMRARGADVTDLVILVVAADDGLMPQTVEAIDHARAANVPIIVAANKIDRPNADVNRIKQQLMEHNLLAEEFGGDTVIVPVSAKTGEGVEQLLEMVHLQAELMELKSVSEGQARGYVIESKMDRQRGPVATVLVQRGTLNIGDDFVAGSTHGRVRAMFDDRGKAVNSVGPSMPAEVLGYNELPIAGDIFVVMEDEKVARQIAQVRTNRGRAEQSAPARRHVTLEDFLQGIQTDEVRELNMVLKADTQGSLEALRSALEKQGNEQVRVNIIRAGVGGITETDISLATTADAVVMGFNVRAQTKAEDLSRAEGVEIKRYTVIYDLINDVHAALEGMLKPIEREEIIGHCEVRRVFSTGKEIKIAGAYVNDGHFERNSHVRLYRDDVLIHTGQIQTLRRFKDDVNSVQSGYECGVRIADFNELKEGDVLEAFITVEEAPRLERAE